MWQREAQQGSSISADREVEVIEFWHELGLIDRESEEYAINTSQRVTSPQRLSNK